MQHRFMTAGGHTCVALNEFEKILQHGKWQIHNTPIGKLYSEYCAAEEVVEVLGKQMCTSEAKPKRNKYASEFFGIDLYGECYLHSTEKLNALVVPAVCKYEREGKTLAQQELPKAKPEKGQNASKRKW